MTQLYFIRHARAVYASDESGRPLSGEGMKDAARVTETLKKEKIDIVLSSPYARAIQTVQGIADYLGQKVEIINGFRERTLAGKRS